MKKGLWLFPAVIIITAGIIAYIAYKNSNNVMNNVGYSPSAGTTVEFEYINAKNEGQIDVPIGIIYSHPFYNKSYFVKISNDKITSAKIKAAGILKMEQSSENEREIWMWSDRVDQLYRFDYETMRLLEMRNLKAPLSLFEDHKQTILKGLNIDFKENRLEYTFKDKEHSIQLPPFLLQALIDRNHIYLFSDIVEKKKSVLYVININDGKIIHTISLNDSFASDIVHYRHYIVLSTKRHVSAVDTRDWSVKYIELPNSTIQPDHFYLFENNLYVSYGDNVTHEAGLLRMNESLNIIANYRFHFPYNSAEFFNDRIYVLSQLPSYNHKSFNGIIGVFSIHDGKKLAQRLLPNKEVKVQDFIILPR
ncbi:hypothetical protein CULT_1300016 [[Clostridium] ultunense Esp]|uniref:hypothetical protein n=1 Tax=Thermicanus aegyptius TaxID=94009 RepID=UPI0002B70ACF|nr:hypothetical protein [Thermicanus aegyptius]CCQ93350.1 hypothetical protein CULT_1300016 [[Clostridium] ultunense Esp]